MHDMIQWILAELWLLPHLTAILVLALMSIRLASNLRFLRRAKSLASRSGDSLPRVSVLVPARDEVLTISDCMSSLLDQQYPNFEILVLDDASTDGTSELLDAIRARSPRLAVFRQTDDPPAGWNAKSYACHTLASHASGEWLLFTDADTVHETNSVACGVAYATALDAALVSAFPYQITQTWSERLLISFLLDVLPLLTIDFTKLARGKLTRAAANGQYLLVNAASYRAIGGHTGIHHDLLDDFSLSRRFLAEGHRIALIQGGGMLSCRMYRTAREVWAGFSKNLLGALDAPRRWYAFLWAPLFAWVYACLFVLSVAHLGSSQQWALGAAEVGWLLLLRGIVVWRLKRPLDEVLSTFLAGWGVMVLGMTTLIRSRRHVPVVWKGRSYTK